MTQLKLEITEIRSNLAIFVNCASMPELEELKARSDCFIYKAL